ncbi:hypothetical protein EDB81DRAFT_150522 [Dactylonectria macrodidyma]|uniref:Clr5 domain-containing protein n=1 Tax=Dactylonectria macrodidyma TaxID=307937 RepID=A0A9P9FPH8_9HYPO|nr:hypothetical protein EDB81DRAFT_150522 [Dactylonectria macrodidyma]
MDINGFLDPGPAISWADQHHFLDQDTEMINLDTPQHLDFGSGAVHPTSILANATSQPRRFDHGHSTHAGPTADQPPSGDPQVSSALQADVAPGSRRSKYGNLDWERHKPQLQQIYLKDNNSLAETMKIMRTQHSFEASQKLYKSKFKDWGWNKNLPGHIAEFMVETAKKRKRDRGSDTVFSYGGRNYDESRAMNTLSRTKQRAENEAEVAATPAGVSYKTPKAFISSPDNGESTDSSETEEQVTSGKMRGTVVSPSHEVDLPLQWNGLTRAHLISTWTEGRTHLQQGRLHSAKELLEQAWEGLAYLNGATNEDVKKVAYELVDLHTQQGSTEAVNKILEQMMQAHIDTWGIEDKRTRQHVIHVVEILNSCNRQEDALGLLSRSKEITEVKSGRSRRNRNRRRRKGKDKAVDSLAASTQLLGVVGLDEAIEPNASPSQIEYRLDVASSHVAARDQAVEPLLLALISHCEKNPFGLHVQNLRARGELLSLYEKLGVVANYGEVFARTPESINVVFDSYPWDSQKSAALDVVEAYIQVAANMVKSNYTVAAKRLFQKAAQKSESLFGYDTERAIWVNITIGLVYQTHRSWAEAKPWFERAYAGALGANWDKEDGIIRALTNALERSHFSYLSDEGRPFKTIFGVMGFTIRPNRLHLE